ncbi:MAG: glutamate formimidoyltransferase [Acidobacteria bacterium]|nr:glutamate formimidoyltransferase [Acidobacteriota bacterium]
MKKIVECIPNFSEGQDAQKIELIASAIASVEGVAVLDRTMDADHNRSVITFAGEPQGVLLAAIRAAATAVELIDLNQHSGEHPRMGALDVLPFVPIKNVTMEECVDLARKAGERIAEELNIPVYLYEQAATRPDRVDLANIRRGGFEAIREEILFHPDRKPDFGPRQIHLTAGAMAVGARNPLIAFNINLATEDLAIAKQIAKAVRGSSGGLQNVKALAMQMAHRHQVQVSMNLVNYEATPIFRAFDLVKREAERYGVMIAGTEIVGLIPQAALNACGEFYLQIEDFSEDLVLENRLHAALADSFPEIGAGFKEDAAIEDSDTSESEPIPPAASTALTSIEQPQAGEIAAGKIAAGSLTPESGSFAAYAGILASELAETVAQNTASSKPSVADEVGVMLDRLEQLRADLQLALKEDVEGRERVLDAMVLPRETDAEKLARSMAIEQATKNAVAVPLRIAESAMQVLEILNELYEMGNAGVFSDLALSAQLAVTAIRGAAYNILPNVMNIGDHEFAEDCRAQIIDLLEGGSEVAMHIEDFFLRLYPSEN